jgi:hypothetical protein
MMNDKIIINWVLFSLFFVFNSWAQEDLKTIPRIKSDAIKNNWELVPGIKATPEEKFNGDSKDIRHKKNGKIFFNKKKKVNNSEFTLDSEDESHVVYNPKRKQFGNVSGKIILNVTSESDVDLLLKTYPVRKIRYEEKLKLLIVKVLVGNDISKVLSDIKKNNNFNNAQLEVSTESIQAK